MFLTEDEIREFTGYLRHSSQAEALRYMGIEFRKRADGSLVVLKSHVDKVLGGVSDAPRKRTRPNMGAVC